MLELGLPTANQVCMLLPQGLSPGAAAASITKQRVPKTHPMHLFAPLLRPQLDLHDREAAAAEARTPQVERRLSRKQSQEQAKAKAADQEGPKTATPEQPSSAGANGDGSGEEKDEVWPRTSTGDPPWPPVVRIPVP